VRSSGFFGFGAGEKLAEGTGRLTYLDAAPGMAPSQVVAIPAGTAGEPLQALYPDGKPNDDVEFVDATGALITSVPSSGTFFEVRLKSDHEGRSFIGVVGNAESKELKEWRLEYSGPAGQAGEGGFLDAGHTIIISAEPVSGPIFRLMAQWDVSKDRLAGQYTIRTRLTDTYLPTLVPDVGTKYTKGPFATLDDLRTALAEFADLRVVDQATFTIGTPVDPMQATPTIVTDPYAKVELRFDPGTLVGTGVWYVNVYPLRAPPQVPLPDAAMNTIGPKYEIFASQREIPSKKMAAEAFVEGGEARLTIKYTKSELQAFPHLTPTLSPPGGGGEGVIEDNFGIYREDPATGTRTLLETNLALGTYTIFTATNYLDGSFLVLPSNSAPRIAAIAVSPLVFSPENASLNRPVAGIYLDVWTGQPHGLYQRRDS